MTIGERIKFYRKKSGLTQQQLAGIAGLSAVCIRQWESGKRTPKHELLKKVAEGLDVPVETFYGDEVCFNAVAAKRHFEKMSELFSEEARDIYENLNVGRAEGKVVFTSQYFEYLGMQKAMILVLDYLEKHSVGISENEGFCN